MIAKVILWLKCVFAHGIVSAFLKEIAKAIIVKAHKAGVFYVKRNIVDKFIKVAEVNGQVYTIYVSTNDAPPEHFMKWYLDTTCLIDIDLYLWGICLTNEEWNSLPNEKKKHFHKF